MAWPQKPVAVKRSELAAILAGFDLNATRARAKIPAESPLRGESVDRTGELAGCLPGFDIFEFSNGRHGNQLS